jgi:hypothetical protein
MRKKFFKFISFCFIFFICNVNIIFALEEDIHYINPKQFTSQYNFELDFGDSTVNTLEAFVPTPQTWNTQTNISLNSYSPNGNVDTENVHNNKYISFNKSHLVDNKLTTKQNFTFTTYEVEVDTDNIVATIPYNTSSELYQKYTKDETCLEKDYFSGNIINSIIGNETDNIKKAKLIYDFVLDHMTYTTENDKAGCAKYAYENPT